MFSFASRFPQSLQSVSHDSRKLRLCDTPDYVSLAIFLLDCAHSIGCSWWLPLNADRGGPTLTLFLVDEGRDDPNTTKSGPSSVHMRNAIKMAFRWRADGCQTLNAVLVAL